MNPICAFEIIKQRYQKKIQQKCDLWISKAD